MGRKSASKYPGLRLRKGVYWIEINNKRYGKVEESTGFREREEELAVRYYHKRMTELAEVKIFGARRRWTWVEAASRHLEEFEGVSIATDALWIEQLLPYLGDLFLDQVHNETLKPYIAARREKGRKGNTINRALEVVRKICLKAARKWRDVDTGKTWLESAPLISMVSTDDKRPPYPLSWEEQDKLLFPELPVHLRQMAVFDVNTGLRNRELCGLRWEWERKVGEITLFFLPGYIINDAGIKERYTKDGVDRIVALNATALKIIEEQRGKHVKYVFPYRGDAIDGVDNTAWQSARARAALKYEQVLGVPCPEGFRTLHVHDLRHTFGRRLRAAGVSVEARAELLGHRAGRGPGEMTTHYSSAEIGELWQAVKKIEVNAGGETPTLTLLRAA